MRRCGRYGRTVRCSRRLPASPITLLVSVCCLACAMVLSACTPSATGFGSRSSNPGGGGAFDWKASDGRKIEVLLNQHPYTDTLIKSMTAFQSKTGIEVDYSLAPEEAYFDKLATLLAAKSGGPDVFMTGAYQIWEYAPEGWLEPLDAYLSDGSKTDPDEMKQICIQMLN